MGSPGRFVLICLVVLLSATGSSDRSSASTADAVRLRSTEPSVTIVRLQKLDLPWPNQADIRERQTLAWIILLMKDGRGAR